MYRFRSLLALATLFLVVGSPAWSAPEPGTIVLNDRSVEAGIAVELVKSAGGGMRLVIDIPAVNVAEVEKNGTVFHDLQIFGSEQVGAVGRPALPVVSRLVALPAGQTVRVADSSFDQVQLGKGYRPLPAQGIVAAGQERFSLDGAYYAGAVESVRVPLVQVGEPALLRGQRVVALTISPVSWDPAGDDLVVARQIVVDLEFVGSQDDARPRTESMLPSSFANLYESTILGYEKDRGQDSGMGTYLIIHPNNATVLSNIQPLIQWRQRQGYHVVVASTALAGSSNTAIKSYIQGIYDTVEPPLEFVSLVGDANGAVAIPTYTENQSGYGGEGDHEYTRLEGGDILADIHIGRISVTSTSELSTVIGKIVSYESAPDMEYTDWFTTAGLTGDPSSSGNSCIFVNQWVKEQLIELNYTQIDTIWSGDFLSQMLATINQGESLFTYRGYWHMSGLSSSYIGILDNKEELPVAVVLTCDTGSFMDDTNCQSEAFLRAAGGGSVAAYGTATIGTHTRYNNCMFQGIVEGLLNSGDPRTGPALTLGKLNMYNNYQLSEPNSVTIWSTWNNLMGDPCTAMWTAVPQLLTVDYPSSITAGANAVPVTVTSGGSPVEGARVALFMDGVVEVSGLTDAAGRIVLPVSSLVNGEVLLTVTGDNLKPHLGGVNVGSASGSIDFASLVIDGDGDADPGDSLELTVELGNSGTGGVSGVDAVLTSPDPLVVVDAGTAGFGYIGSGASATGDSPFVVTLAGDVPGGSVIPLELVATSGGDSWTTLVNLTVMGPAATPTRVDYGTPGGTPDPGESGTVRVVLRNDGNLAGTATGVLSTDSQWVTVTDANGTYASIAPGSTVGNDGDLFGVTVTADCYPGHLASFTLDLTFDNGGTARVEFQSVIGTASSGDPVGPDLANYFGFDNSDTGYDLAPTYEWVEIDPSYGGSGSSLGLYDSSGLNGDTETVDLPFTFDYYGKPYDKISVCSNGWLAMGSTYIVSFRNWTIPSPGSPDNMIAVFWDNLYLDGSSDVLYYHDTVNHRFIVEWSRVRNNAGGQVETFQVHLYDPAEMVGDSGDGVIVMHYETITNVDSQNGYATVGIQNEDRDDGVLYTYWNQNAGGAAGLTSGRAIAFRTVLPQIQGTLAGEVTNRSAGGAAVNGATISVIGASRTLLTTADGSYVGGVPIGTYDVAVSHPSFQPDTTYAVVISEAVQTTVDFELIDIVGPQFALTTMPVNTSDTVGPYEVIVEISDETGIDEQHCWYTSSTSGGPFELALTATGSPDEYRVEIPGQAIGSRVQYWFTGTDSADNDGLAPASAPYSPYAFAITEVVEIYSTDMETADGWTEGDTGDDASTGLWVRVDPNAIIEGSEEIQPEDDHTVSGTMCWVTGNAAAGSTQGAEDVDGGKTTVLSPVFDVTGYAALEVSYYRWYTNDTGNSPNEDTWLVQVQADGGNWVNLENTTASNRSWQLMNFQLDSYVTPTSSVRFRFVASDEGAGSVVEAGVDDFTLKGYSLPGDSEDPTVTLTSFNGGQSVLTGGDMDITWTHADDIGVVDIEILLSDDGGATWPHMVGQGPLSSPTLWTANDIFSTNCMLQITVTDAVGNSTTTESAAVFTIGGSSPVNGLPLNRMALGQNWPNPFNPKTDISFSVPSDGQVTLRVFNIEGRLVRTLVNERMSVGAHTVTWMGKDDRGGQAASGLYFYQLVTGSGTLTKKMTLLK